MKSYGKRVAALVAGWFVFAVTASAFHVVKNPQNRIGVAVAIAATVPIIVFSIWVAASGAFRQFTLSLNPRALTFIQSWRVLGVVFVILEAYRVLPAVFALPAGYGDMTIGFTAPLAALLLAVPRRRASFIAWQLLGILDLAGDNRPRHYGRVARSRRPSHGSDDRPTAQPDSHFCRAAAPDPAPHFHRAGKILGRCFRRCGCWRSALAI